MFKKMKDGSIQSDEGFAIKLMGRAGLLYSEGDKTIDIDSEMLADSRVGYIVASSSIKRWNETGSKINQDEQLKVLNNIKKAFSFLGFEIKVIKDF